MQIVRVSGMNDGHMAASESVLMDVLLMSDKHTHRYPSWLRTCLNPSLYPPDCRLAL